MADDATPPHPTDAPTDVPTNAPADAPADEALGAFADRATTEVSRTVDLDADAGDVWRAVSDPDERALWLDDPDAVSRRIRVDEATPGERLVWTWWRPGDEGDASTVTVELHPVIGGGTRVVVTEALPAPQPMACAAVGAADAGSGAPVAGIRPSPCLLRWVHDRWDARVLGLELLFAVARAGVV
jgi:uncharacterized protein YndB with AHSA1/START domain